MSKRRFALSFLPFALSASPAVAQNSGSEVTPAETPSLDAPTSEISESDQDASVGSSTDAKEAEKLVLVYDVPPECPSRQAFLARLSEDAAPYRFAFHETDGTFSLRISASEEGFDGLSKLDRASTGGEERRVAAPTCTEVLDILAVMLGFQLRTETSGGDLSDVPQCPLCEESSKKAKVDDRFSPQYGSSLTRRPRWAKKVAFVREKETSDGPLRLQTHLAFDAHFGLTMGLLPGQPVPRFDVTARTALFLTAPGDRAFLMGFIPRLRFNAHLPQEEQVDSSLVGLSGFGFGIGGCLSPYYDPKGVVVLACADYGGEQYLLDASYPEQGMGYIYETWANKFNLSLEVEYHVGSHFFVGGRGGVETNSYPNGVSFSEEDVALFEPGAMTGFVTGGVGLQF